MDNKQMELFLDKIGELVIDEEKIVTYKSLSKILDIHVNTAKQLLYTYLSKQKNESSVPISATYLLAGKLADGSFNISVLNETDLESSYSKFVEITSEHVYSIQKGKHVKEIQVLCGIDKQVQNVSSSPVIKCSKSILKTKINDDDKTEGSKTKSPIKTKLMVEKDKESNGKIESCSKTNSKDNMSKGNKEKETKSTKKQSGSIATFFFNTAQKNLNKPKNVLKTKNISPSKDEPKSSAVTTKAEVVEKDEQKKVESQSKENVKKKNVSNKRKRIQMISESEERNSESDNEEALIKEEEEEEEIPDTLPLSIILEEEEISKDQPQNQKKKKRKLVDKVIMNEDGFMETKLEEVIESDSEDDDGEKVAPSKKGDPATKKLKLDSFFGVKDKKTSTSKPAKVQSSMLAFLKKK